MWLWIDFRSRRSTPAINTGDQHRRSALRECAAARSWPCVPLNCISCARTWCRPGPRGRHLGAGRGRHSADAGCPGEVHGLWWRERLGAQPLYPSPCRRGARRQTGAHRPVGAASLPREQSLFEDHFRRAHRGADGALPASYAGTAATSTWWNSTATSPSTQSGGATPYEWHGCALTSLLAASPLSAKAGVPASAEAVSRRSAQARPPRRGARPLERRLRPRWPAGRRATAPACH
jgi:hypothetical protein